MHTVDDVRARCVFCVAFVNIDKNEIKLGIYVIGSNKWQLLSSNCYISKFESSEVDERGHAHAVSGAFIHQQHVVKQYPHEDIADVVHSIIKDCKKPWHDDVDLLTFKSTSGTPTQSSVSVGNATTQSSTATTKALRKPQVVKPTIEKANKVQSDRSLRLRLDSAQKMSAPPSSVISAKRCRDNSPGDTSNDNSIKQKSKGALLSKQKPIVKIPIAKPSPKRKKVDVDVTKKRKADQTEQMIVSKNAQP
jgi:hypothetical protein